MKELFLHLYRSLGASALEFLMVVAYAIVGFSILFSVFFYNSRRKGMAWWHVFGPGKFTDFKFAWYEWLWLLLAFILTNALGVYLLRLWSATVAAAGTVR